MHIPVVDIFAGPGGLGEGFSAFAAAEAEGPAFRIAVSAEMEQNAARTLRLRAFFRQFTKGRVPDSYYDYVAGRVDAPWTDTTREKWDAACHEALQLTLGEPGDDSLLNERIARGIKGDEPWVLIGGPPCQAYSLVGRARNQGISGYSPKNDDRHFLYKHYLRVIHRFEPAVFVMENVKGILSSKVDEEMIFPRIIEDLQKPGGRTGVGYKVVPLMMPEKGREVRSGKDFIIRAEYLGVPQARHRVVMLGLRDDVPVRMDAFLRPGDDLYSVADVIGGMPRLRSGLTDADFDTWQDKASELLNTASTAAKAQYPRVGERLSRLSKSVLGKGDPGTGGRWRREVAGIAAVPRHLSGWLLDPRLHGVLNHEVRSHMSSDLVRYAYAAAFAKEHGYSPRGAQEFPESLHPSHGNWQSGKFVDRFKVQQWGLPSSTITSHLAKDGHYFIHPDAGQLRSLSVREAARLQTFPDNYFFEGSRGAQYRQVGNAVPPWLAKQIAAVVHTHLVA